MSPFMRYVFTVAFGAVMPLLLCCTLCAQGGRGSIVVEITGFRNSVGQAGVLLFSREEGFPADPDLAVRRLFSAIVRDACRVTLEDVPYGTYAVSVFHDENADGKLQKNFFGIPREGVGASGNPGMKFGPPKFRDACFTLDSPELKLAITVKYLHAQRERKHGDGRTGH